MSNIERRTVIKLAGAAATAAALGSFKAGEARAERPAGEGFDLARRTIKESALPEELRRLSSPAKMTYGKIYCVWPNSDGSILFEVSTPAGGVAYVIRTGASATESMMKVLMFAYEKQIAVWVIEDPAHPQVAMSIVTITL
jgi:hypothetical protein